MAVELAAAPVALAEAPTTTPTPTIQHKPDKKNVNLFDLTLLIFTISKRATESIIEDVTTKDMPLAEKKANMAESLLAPDHPQRKQHVQNLANTKTLIALCEELLKAIATARLSYSVNMPKYSTGLFAGYNRTCVERFIDHIKVDCAKMRETYPAVADGPHLRKLEGLQSHIECCECPQVY